MASSTLEKIEYLVLLVAVFALRSNLTEAEAYRYLNRYGAIALCEKHYGIMHTLSLDENIQTLQVYCQRKAEKYDRRTVEHDSRIGDRFDKVKGGSL